MNRRFFLRLVWAVALTGTGFCLQSCTSSEDANPASAVGTPTTQWATKINLPGVPNLYKVSDDLYRGAQPSEDGFKQLEKSGIKTVVNLRSSHSDHDMLTGANLNYEHIPMTAWHPKNEDVVKFLKIAADANLTPVFVHCKRGADRTGLMCAIYRVAVQGWSKDEAIEEMTKGDYGFYSIWQNIIHYIRKLDVEKIRQQAGIED
ncbi:MAG: dual specificity protein phosphatase family protein [Planctomycetota bacterium]